MWPDQVSKYGTIDLDALLNSLLRVRLTYVTVDTFYSTTIKSVGQLILVYHNIMRNLARFFKISLTEELTSWRRDKKYVGCIGLSFRMNALIVWDAIEHTAVELKTPRRDGGW